MIKKILKITGILFLILILLVVAFLVYLSLIPAVPNNYTKTVKTGGEIEAKYLAMGSYKVKNIKSEATELTKFNYVYYPEELESSNESYPVIVVLNGTGVLPDKYKALFRHLASWGFIVVGTDDGSSGFGTSADETVVFIEKANSDKDSLFYEKIDLENIGITGHSQGGAGVFTAVSIMEQKEKYKTAVSLSPTHEEMAHAFGWNYDLTKISIPILMIAGTAGEFETEAVIPFDKMTAMYEKIPSEKAMMRKTGAEHGQMLYSADGYVTAWFMWQLQNDEEAAKAFIKENPEVLENELYQDQKIDLSEK